MTSHSWLSWILLAEVGLIFACAVGLVATAAWRTVRRPRLTRRLEDARAVLVGTATRTRQQEGSAPAAELAALPLEARIELFANAGASLHGAARGRLNDLAGTAGMRIAAARSCRSRRWSGRLRGVRIYTLMGGGHGVVPGLMSDRHPEVRAAAARWAADNPRPAVIARLLMLLDDEAPLARFVATDALVRLSGPAVEPLVGYLSTQHSRRATERAMEAAAGIADPRLLPSALARARDASARTRELAADIAGSIGGEAAVNVLVSQLDDPEPRVRSAAARGLGRRGHWPAAPRLAEALRDPAWSVRQQAGLALSAIGAPGLIMLRGALDDEDRFASDMARQVLDLPGNRVDGSAAC